VVAPDCEGRIGTVPEDEEDDRIYKVVVNHEEQYSIWFADREPPAGWREVGKEGPKADCLEYINEVWTDMRPLSLRKQMEEAASQGPAEA
jgi:MbtH protein